VSETLLFSILGMLNCCENIIIAIIVGLMVVSCAILNIKLNFFTHPVLHQTSQRYITF